MKCAILMWLCAAVISAQITSSQITKKSDGSFNGDTNHAVKITIYRSTTAPASPLTAGDVWCDSNSTPCVFKIYDGSAWQIADTLSQDTTWPDLTAFPSAPTDGYWFFDRKHGFPWIYNSTDSAWYRMDGQTLKTATGPGFTDNFTGSTIADPSAGMTIADGGAGGTATGGTYSCKVTFSSSTGGETNPSSQTSSVAITASHAITFSSVPTGGTGTTQRRLYCSKSTAASSGPWWYWGTINDNSSSSATINGVTDANLKISAPNRNYSAPLNGRWNISNMTTSGGCGSRGTSIGSMVCKVPSAGTAQQNTSLTDTALTAWFSMAPLQNSNFTISYRVTNVEGVFGGGINTGAPGYGGLSYGTAWSQGPEEFTVYGSTNLSGYLGQNNVWAPMYCDRPQPNVACANGASLVGSFQRITSFPIYFKIQHYANAYMAFFSRDGVTWSPVYPISSSVTPTDANISIGGVLFPQPLDTFFIGMVQNNASGVDANIEIDSLTVTADY